MSEGPPTSGSGAKPEGQPAQPVQPEVPAGWYPHPTAPGWEAYWTGSGWGPDTRPAQAAPEPPEAQPAQEAQPAAQQAQQAQTEVQPTAGTAAAAAGAGAAAQAQPAQAEPAEVTPAAGTSGTATADPAATAGGAPPGAAATPAAAAAVATAPKERSDSSLPVVLCVLGAIVAIVGSFLPMASSSFDGIDFVDNTLVGQSFGIVVIAVAILGAVLAAWSYLKGNRTWLVAVAGVVIIAIAAYMGLVGVDDLTPDVPVPATSGGGNGGSTQFSGDLAEAINLDASPSTGIFAVAVGGLLMALGGIGLARENR